MSMWREKLYESAPVSPEAYAQHWIQKIKAECGPWLKASKGHDVYRGMHIDPTIGGVFERKVRPDRNPSSSDRELHRALIDRIEADGCYANRHNSMFVTGSKDMTDGYGWQYIVYPVGPFDFTWSSEVTDAYVDIGEEMGDPEMLGIEGLYQCDPGSLSRAVRSGNEIMIACKTAICVPVDDSVDNRLQFKLPFDEIIEGVRS